MGGWGGEGGHFLSKNTRNIKHWNILLAVPIVLDNNTQNSPFAQQTGCVCVRWSQVWCGRENSSAVHGGTRCESTGRRFGFVSRILAHSLTQELVCRGGREGQVKQKSLVRFPPAVILILCEPVCLAFCQQHARALAVPSPRLSLHRASACTLNAVGLMPVSGCGDARVAPPYLTQTYTGHREEDPRWRTLHSGRSRGITDNAHWQRTARHLID